MQSQDPNTPIPSAVTHPDPAEWMAFLYRETPSARRRELDAHLASCPACAAQVTAWRGSQSALDGWELPPARHWRRAWTPQPGARSVRAVARLGLPLLRWAAAAALVLALGFGLGRRTAPGARELSELKLSVARLAQGVQGEQSAWSNYAALATAGAGAETLRLLSEYARAQDSERTLDQQSFQLALQKVDTRLDQLRAALETVALNTEDGFQQTHQNLERLVSYSAPARSAVPTFGPESK